MDELKRIRTFIKVVETGSFSAAARDASSISSVARQIKSLEDDLGARLFNRNTRNAASLTEAGEVLYAKAQALVGDFESIRTEVISIRDEVKGRLRVALRIAAGATIVLPALPRLFAQYPDLELDILLTDKRLDLIANKIDVALWMGDMPNADIVARPVSASNRLVCATPAYLARHGRPSVPSDLAAHSCLCFTAPAYGRKWLFNKDGQAIEVEVGGKVQSDNGLVLLSCALMDLGLVLIPDWMARTHLDAGRLVKVLAGYTARPYPGHAVHYAVYPSSRRQSRKIRVFVDFLVEAFREAAQETS